MTYSLKRQVLDVFSPYSHTTQLGMQKRMQWERWFEWKWPHQLLCSITVPSWWTVGRIRRCGFIGEGMSLWAEFRVSKALSSDCISICKLSPSDPTTPCLPDGCHYPCHDVHGVLPSGTQFGYGLNSGALSCLELFLWNKRVSASASKSWDWRYVPPRLA